MLLYTSRYTPNDFLPMNASSNLRLNGLGGVYSAGKAFPEAKWAEILIRYTNIILDEDQCSASRLSNEYCISRAAVQAKLSYTLRSACFLLLSSRVMEGLVLVLCADSQWNIVISISTISTNAIHHVNCLDT